MATEDPIDLPPKLEEHLCFGIYATSMAITRAYKPMLDDLGITYPQYLVLTILWEEDGHSISALANRMGLEPSTITPLVKRLEVSGLVTRTRDLEDERIVVVRLTETGKEMRGKAACLSQLLFNIIDRHVTSFKRYADRANNFRAHVETYGTRRRSDRT